MAGATLGFGTMPNIRKPKPPVIDTNGRPSTGASFSAAPQVGPAQGGVQSTPGVGGGRLISPVISTPPGQGGKVNTKPVSTPLGSDPTGAAPKGTPGTATTPGAAPPPSGAPDPGTPNTGAIPPIQSDEDAITDANTGYGQAYNTAYGSLQDAALSYGDPTIMGQYGVGTVNPNSALALAAVKALQANQANDATQTNNGTFFSSINQNARGLIADQQSRDDLAGSQAWNDALAAFNRLVGPGGTATTSRDQAIRNAHEDEATQAVKNLPTVAAPVPKPTTPSTAGPTPTGPSKTQGVTHSPTPTKTTKAPAHGIGAALTTPSQSPNIGGKITFNIPKVKK